ncbi:HPr family phosphocarrier protein [Caproiciproducens sp.]
MLERTVTVTNKTGLHARPAGGLVKLAQKYDSSVTILFGDKIINAKRIFSVLGGVIVTGSTITLRIEGADEDRAMAEIAEYIKNLKE